MCRTKRGVDVPMPRPLSVLFQKKLFASPLNTEPFANCTAPVVPPTLALPPEIQAPLMNMQPLRRVMPLLKVLVAVPVCAKFKTERPPEKVEVPTPCTARFPVVVAPPLIVSPVVCAPAPMVDEP